MSTVCPQGHRCGIDSRTGFFSPKFERASIPLPEADGAVSAGGGQVAFGAAAERRKLHPRGRRE